MKCHHSLTVKTERHNSVTFSNHSVDCVAGKFQEPTSNIRFSINFVLKELIFCVFFHILTVTPCLRHKKDTYL